MLRLTNRHLRRKASATGQAGLPPVSRSLFKVRLAPAPALLLQTASLVTVLAVLPSAYAHADTLTLAALTENDVISGNSSVEATGGTVTLTNFDDYSGATTIDKGATLSLSGPEEHADNWFPTHPDGTPLVSYGGAVRNSLITDNGTLDLSGSADFSVSDGQGRGAAISGLAGNGTVLLGNRDLGITGQNSTFSGTVTSDPSAQGGRPVINVPAGATVGPSYAQIIVGDPALNNNGTAGSGALSAPKAPASWTVSGGHLTSGTLMVENGTLTLNNGTTAQTVDYTSGNTTTGRIEIGNRAGTTGVLNITGTGTVANAGMVMFLGEGDAGVNPVSGQPLTGSVTAGLNVTEGGTLNTPVLAAGIHGNTTSHILVDGAGSTIVSGQPASAQHALAQADALANADGSVATLTVSHQGRFVENNGLNVGVYGTAKGSVTLASGGEMDIGPNARLRLAGESGTYGHIALNDGGVLAVGGDHGVMAGSGNAGVDFAGGQMKAVGGTPLTVYAPVNIASGSSATFTSDGKTDTALYGTISGAGNLVKASDNTLTLNGTDNHTGNTDIQAGTLTVMGDSHAAQTTVEQGAVLNGSGHLDGNVVMNGNLTVGSDTGGTHQTGTLNIAGNLQMGNNTVTTFHESTPNGGGAGSGGPGNDLIKVGGNLGLAGLINVASQTGSNLGAGVYGLMTYGGTLTSDTAKLGTVATVQNAVLQTSVGHEVNVVLTSSQASGAGMQRMVKLSAGSVAGATSSTSANPSPVSASPSTPAAPSATASTTSSASSAASSGTAAGQAAVATATVATSTQASTQSATATPSTISSTTAATTATATVANSSTKASPEVSTRIAAAEPASSQQPNIQTATTQPAHTQAQAPTAPALAFWNGSGSANGALKGGKGVWAVNTKAAWANANATAQGDWQEGSFAIFQGRSGTVQLKSPVSAAGMQFASNGYTLKGDAISASGTTLTVRVGNGTETGQRISATLQSALTGGATLDKTDAGTLILRAQNSYTGGTLVSGGTLNAQRGTLGSGDVAVLQGATLLTAQNSVAQSAAVVDNGTWSFSGAKDNRLAGQGQLIKTGKSGSTLTNAGFTGNTDIQQGSLTMEGGFGTGLNIAKKATATAIIAKNDQGNAYEGSAMTGAGTFVKEGDGTLVLDRDSSTYTGTLKAQQGTLALKGDMGKASAAVASGATFGGAGAIGTVTVAQQGTLVANGLNVEKNLTSKNGNIQLIGVKGGTALTVGGKANLQGGSVTYENGTGGTVKAGAHYDILTAAGGLKMKGVTLNTNYHAVNGLMQVVMKEDANSLYLTAQRNMLMMAARWVSSVHGGTYNEAQVGHAIDAMRGNAIWTAIGGMTNAQVLRGMDGLSGQVHANARAAMAENSYYIRDLVLARMTDVLDQHDTRGKKLASGALDRVTWWGNAFGAMGGMGGRGSMNNSDAGWVMGADTRFKDGWMLGGNIAYGRASYSDRGAAQGSGYSNDVSVGLYGGNAWKAGIGAVTLKAGVDYTFNLMHMNRRVAMGAGNSAYSARHSSAYQGGTAQAFAETGYQMHLWTGGMLEPFMRGTYVNMQTQRWHENGSVSALQGAGKQSSLEYGTFGLRARHDFQLFHTMFTAHGMAAYRHAWGTTNLSSRENFRGVAGSGMNILSVPVAANTALVDAGVDAHVTNRVDVGLGFIGQYGAHQTMSGGTGHVSVKF